MPYYGRWFTPSWGLEHLDAAHHGTASSMSRETLAVFWPDMKRDATAHKKACRTCTPSPPLQSTPPPTAQVPTNTTPSGTGLLPSTTPLHLLVTIHHTLSILLGIQFRQRSTHKKERKLFFYILGLAGPCDPRLPETYSIFVQSSLRIDLWMEKWEILMIFSYFS